MRSIQSNTMTFSALALLANVWAIPGTWVQTSLIFVQGPTLKFDVGIGYFSGDSETPVGYQSGIDNSDQPHKYPKKRTGDDPIPGPAWNTNFTPLVDTTWDQQAWEIPAQTIPAHYFLHCVSKWNNKNGKQEFDERVGSATVSFAARQLDWWTKLGYQVILEPSSGVGVDG